MEDRWPRGSCWAAPSRCCSTTTASAAAMGCPCRPCLLCLPACASAGRGWSAPRQVRSLCGPESVRNNGCKNSPSTHSIPPGIHVTGCRHGTQGARQVTQQLSVGCQPFVTSGACGFKSNDSGALRIGCAGSSLQQHGRQTATPPATWAAKSRARCCPEARPCGDGGLPAGKGAPSGVSQLGLHENCNLDTLPINCPDAAVFQPT